MVASRPLATILEHPKDPEFAMFTVEELDIYFDDFSQPAILRLNGADVKTVDCIFNSLTEVVSPHTAEMVLSRPEAWFKGADVEGLGKEHTILTDGIEYKQHGQPKSEGPFTRILLVKK
jgi:hypothetical protein